MIANCRQLHAVPGIPARGDGLGPESRGAGREEIRPAGTCGTSDTAGTAGDALELFSPEFV
jgi:hypothetical protein